MRLINKLVIQAVKDNLEDVTAFIEARLEEAEISENTIKQLCTSAEEIFVSIAEYAYAPDVGMAEIEIETDGSTVRLTFSDKGRQFDPVKAGIHDVSCERRNGRNVIVLIKNV